MKNKDIKKIQFSGWDKRDFKNIRHEVNQGFPDAPVGSLKKKKSCKYNKGVHEFELIKKGELDWWKEIWYQYKCKNCGKLKHEFQKEKKAQ